jgi:hypothetical protein
MNRETESRLRQERARNGVKQWVAVIKNSRGVRFVVFTTGDDKYYLFSALRGPAPGVEFTGVQFPVLRKNLRKDIRYALAHGYGNSL